MKTISKGVRIPMKLYELVMSAEPSKTFSDVVRCALEKEYGPIDYDSETVHGAPDIDVDSLVERMFQNVHQDKDVP